MQTHSIVKKGNIALLAMLTMNLVMPEQDWFLPSAEASLPGTTTIMSSMSASALSLLEEDDSVNDPVVEEFIAFNKEIHTHLFGPVADEHAHPWYFPQEEINSCGTYYGPSHHIPLGTAVEDMTEPEARVDTRFVVHYLEEVGEREPIPDHPSWWGEMFVALVTIHNEETGAYINCFSMINNYYTLAGLSTDGSPGDASLDFHYQMTEIVNDLTLIDALGGGPKPVLSKKRPGQFTPLLPDLLPTPNQLSPLQYQLFVQTLDETLAGSDGCGDFRQAMMNIDMTEIFNDVLEPHGGKLVKPGDALYMPLFNAAITGQNSVDTNGRTIHFDSDSPLVNVNENGLGNFIIWEGSKGSESGGEFRSSEDDGSGAFIECVLAALGAFGWGIVAALAAYALCRIACKLGCHACGVAARVCYGLCLALVWTWWGGVACALVCTGILFACKAYACMGPCASDCKQTIVAVLSGAAINAIAACFGVIYY